ncbi:MAG: biopolymer transporter ExbD [Lutibacter sp.]|uniref:ExbD/TolR family protein n=1 Tax=Lutibacter sp. TaxID=1925666 RepID=UPI0019E57EB6|nr:biopolymer transporter ExbD [Lutibacter sp.]NOR28705.1 biopolymer transporter ExbD [Lutibacter sp.]
MSKFKKKKKGLPAISTASLPDIVFMLLFFFMVSTTMRETDLLLKKPVLPTASEVKKLEHKSLVSTIYVGKSKDARIAGDKIQVNDKIIDINDIPSFIFSERALRKEEEVKYMTTSIKADKEASVGTILDIKEQLRDINALKISFSTTRGSDLKSNY